MKGMFHRAAKVDRKKKDAKSQKKEEEPEEVVDDKARLSWLFWMELFEKYET